MAYPWFKFYGGDYLHDQKLLGMDGNMRSCWLTLLCYASTSEPQGTILYLTEDLLMIQAGVPMGGEEWERTRGVLQRFAARGMITLQDEAIVITNWGKRQAMHPSEGERKRRYRDISGTSPGHMSENVPLRRRIEEEVDKNTLFDRVWGVYPKKIGKQEAKRAFLKLNPDEELTSRIVSAIALAKTTSQWKDNEGRYIPHCATYLNQRRFEDELPIPKPVVVGYEITEKGARPVFDPEIQEIARKMKVQET